MHTKAKNVLIDTLGGNQTSVPPIVKITALWDVCTINFINKYILENVTIFVFEL